MKISNIMFQHHFWIMQFLERKYKELVSVLQWVVLSFLSIAWLICTFVKSKKGVALKYTLHAAVFKQGGVHPHTNRKENLKNKAKTRISVRRSSGLPPSHTVHTYKKKKHRKIKTRAFVWNNKKVEWMNFLWLSPSTRTKA